MKKFKLQVNSFLLIFLSVLMSCGPGTKDKSSRVETLPFYKDASFTPYWHNPGSRDLFEFHKISPFSLVNQDGATITEKTFQDKIYVTDFFFTTCPGICLRMTNNMLLLQEAFLDDDDVLLLSHSVTPKMDSVPVLKAYANNKKIFSETWHLVTGDRSEIYKLGRQDYFVEEDLGLDKAPDEFLHTENFVLIDGNRHIRGIYNGLNLNSIQQLIADVHTLKRE